MDGSRTLVAVVLAVGMVAGGLLAQDLRPEEADDLLKGRGLVNWAAPLFWSSGELAPGPESSDEGTIRAKATPTSPLPFIGITPCRLVDTRSASMPPGYGPPSLAAGVPAARTFLLAGQCGIGTTAQAVSLNITVTNTLGPGYIVLYPQGSLLPPVSTLTYSAGQTVANAAILPLGGGGLTVVAGVSGTDLIIDTNGYYAAAGVGSQNTFVGLGAGTNMMTGDGNTATGFVALFSNTTGDFNTASGNVALYSNTAGFGNTASGNASLFSNTTGNRNTAVGEQALFNNTTGHYGTAVGYRALENNSTGQQNTAVGTNAGINLTAGNYNLYLANEGVASESGTIRVGSGLIHTRAFIAAVRGVTTGAANAVPVVIDSFGQLGTVSSSRRYKQEIEDMAGSSSGLMKLRPVSFRYKGQGEHRKQFGLIAEEVDEVLPELVVHDPAGNAETVLYHEMPAMLLNELQKQERQIQNQAEEVAALRARLAALEALLWATAQPSLDETRQLDTELRVTAPTVSQ